MRADLQRSPAKGVPLTSSPGSAGQHDDAIVASSSGVPVSDGSGNRRSYGFAQETRPTMRLTVVAVVMAVEAVESNEPAVRALSCPGCR